MLSWLSGKILNLCGWSIVGQLPQVQKYIIVVAPHTSNWDFFIFLLLKFQQRIKLNFFGKHTIFIWPFNWFLRKIGGIPVNRSKSHNVVDLIVQAFNDNSQMIFALSPEGTRSYKDHWKSGFYHIAIAANVPVQTCFLDTKTRTLGFGPLVNICGDQEQDLEIFRSIFHNKQGINPTLASKIIFKSK